MDNVINTHGTLIIAGFPGVGKTYCVNNKELNKKYKMIDSDSSSYSRSSEFPDNYIDHIKSYFGEYDIVFISTHQLVRETLEEEKIPYIIVYPENTMPVKTEYLNRYNKRGSEYNFINFMNNNWEKFLDEIFIEGWPVHYELKGKETLNDVIQYIYELNKSAKK